MSSSKQRILILSTSAGSGHVRSGEALQKEFSLRPEVETVYHYDALDFTNKLFSDFYSKLYTKLVSSAPDFLGWWYKKSDEPWKTDRARLIFDRINTQPLVKFIREFRPHHCVCTHFMPAGILSYLGRNDDFPGKLSIVVTDFEFHAMWLSRRFDRYFVANEEVKAQMTALGLPSPKITVSGIPIDPVFQVAKPKDVFRRQMGLANDRTTLLFCGSGITVEDSEAIVRQISALEYPVQTVIVCGKNVELYQRLRQKLRFLKSAVHFHLLGYTDKMDEYMAVSDLYIGKPGGLTSAEALARGLPLMIVSPIPGQEERNSDYLLENGVAVRCNNLGVFSFKLKKLLMESGTLNLMKDKCVEISYPLSASTVATNLLTSSSRESRHGTR